MVDVLLPSRTSIQISTKNKAYVFYTNRARQMKDMIDLYLHETDMVITLKLLLMNFFLKHEICLNFIHKDDICFLL